jgi:hypothetical protein
MKYRRYPIRVIHIDYLDILRDKPALNARADVTLYRHPVLSKTALPIQINFKYLISQRETPLFTYVTETRAIVGNDGKPLLQEEIKQLIHSLETLVEERWEDYTRNAHFFGNIVPRIADGQLESFTQTIQKWMAKLLRVSD